MAINCSLEREVRKQKAELRRFRRLSRTGQLSLATSRSVSGAFSALTEDSEALALDFSETLLDNEDGLVSDDDASSPMSPNSQVDSDARHRIADERRLQFDLSRHREMLVDSQKMSLSLKRCLGWSDEMINEGRKALDYKVRASEFGPRVLATGVDEEEQPGARAGGETSSTPWDSPTEDGERRSFESQRTDKDSGIDVEHATSAHAAAQQEERSKGDLICR